MESTLTCRKRERTENEQQIESEKGKNKEKGESSSSYNSPKSSGSEKFIISTDKDSFKVCKLKGRKALSDELKKIKNPFSILDENIISEFKSNVEDLEEGTSFKKEIDLTKFSKDKFLFLNDEDNIEMFYQNQKINNIIFSSLNDSYFNKDEELYIKIKHFGNNLEKICNISDFCIEHKKIFPNNSIDKYYGMIRKERSHLFRYHLYNKKKVIMKYFGPRKSCKSIYSRCVIANYHYKYNIFRPILYLDIHFISNNIQKSKNCVREEIYYELFNLFRHYEDINKFMNKIDFKETEAMIFVENIINLFLEYKKINNLVQIKPTIILDNYSYIYDNYNKLENIEKNSKTINEYDLYIIYSIIDQMDQKAFTKELKTTKFNPSFGEIYPVCYLPALRYLSEIKNDLIKDGYAIPKEYEKIFGENVYYLFKFLKSNDKFEDFIETEKIKIINDLEYFYSKVPDKIKEMEKLISIIDGKKEINFDQNLFMNIPSSYIIINRKENEKTKDYYYILEYSFPLIKTILTNLSKKTFFIDIAHKDFLNLNDIAQSIFFDECINRYLKNEDVIFGYQKDEIEKCIDEHCLEKNNFDKEGNQIYLRTDVMKVLKANKSENFLNLVNKYKNKDRLKNKKLIIVFQNIRGKFVDILFLVQKDNNNDNNNLNNDNIIVNNDYSIVNLQIKLSKTFTVTKKEKEQEKYQMTYLKEKYNIIFGINIVDSYIIYISILELKKKFAEKNPDICIYFSREKYKIVDINGNVFEKFPFLPKSKVKLISKFNIFVNSFKILLEEQNNKSLKFIKQDKEPKQDYIKFEITKDKIKVFIKYQSSHIHEKINEQKFKIGTIYYSIIEIDTLDSD